MPTALAVSLFGHVVLVLLLTLGLPALFEPEKKMLEPEYQRFLTSVTVYEWDGGP